jgi:hypothetical protein
MFKAPVACAVIELELTLSAVAEPIAPVPIFPAAVRLSGPNSWPFVPSTMLPLLLAVSVSDEPVEFPKTPLIVIVPLAMTLLAKGVMIVDGLIVRAPPVVKSNAPRGLPIEVTVKNDLVESLILTELAVLIDKDSVFS